MMQDIKCDSYCPFFSPALTIGLQQTMYTVNEGDPLVSVCAEVTSGAVGRETIASLVSQQNTATREPNYSANAWELRRSQCQTHFHDYAIIRNRWTNLSCIVDNDESVRPINRSIFTISFFLLYKTWVLNSQFKRPDFYLRQNLFLFFTHCPLSLATINYTYSTIVSFSFIQLLVIMRRPLRYWPLILVKQ